MMERHARFELVIFSVLVECRWRVRRNRTVLGQVRRVKGIVSFHAMNAGWLKVWVTLSWYAVMGFGCTHHDAPSLAKDTEDTGTLRAGQAAPARSEVEAAGAIRAPIRRGQAAFGRLVRSDYPGIVFKDEEGTGADRMMSRRLRSRMHRLADRVQREWPGVSLRVTEAWDEQLEHGKQSLHYEGRAADLTTSDRDPSKLGRLAGLAVQTGMDWVYFENASHVHVSVKP